MEEKIKSPLSRQNPKTKEKTKNIFVKILQWFAVLATIVFILGGIAFISVFFYEQLHENKIFPGVAVGNISLGNKTQQEALILLNLKKDKFINDGITFFYGDDMMVVSSEILSSDPDLSKSIITIDAKKSVEKAYTYGRGSNLMQDVIQQIYNAIYKKNIPVEFSLNETEIINILKNEFASLENPSQDAHLIINGDDLLVTPEKEGKIFDYVSAIKKLKNNLSRLENDPIELSYITTAPKIFAKDAQDIIPLAKTFLNTTTPAFVYNEKSWKISRKQLIDWLELSSVKNKKRSNQISLQLNKESVGIFLDDAANEIKIDPMDAKFELVDGRVTQFQISRNGKKLNLESSYRKINQQYFEEGKNEIELIVDIIPAKVATEDVNNLGIKELLGVGASNFSGSPKNRRLNIANGAKLLNGILIKPGEEFSLLNALKPFDDTNGYLPELVIKGDRTIPEFGGGLCQIGTTTFRAALYSGLPITERRNHSYRVVYYEPAGMDATIYEPAPDFKFINDTHGYILITTEMNKDNLVFKFYGTPDGRKAEVTTPKIYNITQPGEPKYIETEDIPPGEKKLVEKPHNGADADFDYTVTYPDGRIEKKNFASHYVAWRETWLVGKDPNAQSATSTPETQGLISSFN